MNVKCQIANEAESTMKTDMNERNTRSQNKRSTNTRTKPENSFKSYENPPPGLINVCHTDHFCRKRTTSQRTVYLMITVMRMPGTSWLMSPPKDCGCLWAKRRMRIQCTISSEKINAVKKRQGSNN
ncbi:uncharacterized protein LOC127421562 isoform X5 [Myxocyprinus asiaticus]|uniref:uncharacterized protein LOC127421562 isoform X5 n=1 Tax=Myxocyprinus asiaticus TaxID=70543 RepID=UPI002223C34F|nr:uncharacterized protein LOC127421562 isoform X5 [Myxocyprinus asiaticus]